MKPSKKSLQHDFPGLSEEQIDDYLDCLNNNYFSYFSDEERKMHLHSISKLSSKKPVRLLLRINADYTLDCTFTGYDQPSAFLSITGILASSGFDIISGNVFTYRPFSHSEPKKPNLLLNKRILKKEPKKRIIIDHFQGRLHNNISIRKWFIDVKEKIKETFILLEENTADSRNKANQIVNIMVAKKLSSLKQNYPPKIHPVKIKINNKFPNYTKVKVTSQDTPFFLYSLASSLANHQISIEHIEIKKKGKWVNDEFYVVKNNGKKITDPIELKQLKIYIMLTKQMAYFIDHAPNPSTAISRFCLLVSDTIKLSQFDEWLEFFSNPKILQDTARILSASDFIWEDFIRLQYEELIPILKPQYKKDSDIQNYKDLKNKLANSLNSVKTFEEKKQNLNKFKDKQTFLIELDHILDNSNLNSLSKQLSKLSELVINQTIKIVYQDLVSKYGNPQTIAGIETKYAVFGLGKFGGAEIGYASDIELMFIYSDNGTTNGTTRISNSEFFDSLVREVNNFIEASQNKFFQIDLRLRPYGNDGPLGISLESFSNYYGHKGPAHFYEMLSLVRLRYICGDKTFGKRIEKLRNTLVFSSCDIKLDELWELRKKQYENKIAITPNVKYCPGGLVDIEYTIQSLQVIYGRKNLKLRTSKIQKAILELKRAGILKTEEYNQLTSAYSFFQKLVNGLRMLRGSAKDLFLPDPKSEDYEYLARRIGYINDESIESTQKLQLDFDTHTATVRHFLENHFKDISLPIQQIANVADLILAENVSSELQTKVLTKKHFENIERAYLNLKEMANKLEESDRFLFARLAVLACNWISQKPDPDRTLNNWNRFTAAISNPKEHYKILLKQPMRLEILLDIFSASQFLSRSLIQYPEFFNYVTSLDKLHSKRNCLILSKEMAHYLKDADKNNWLSKIRNFRKREILRIATRDISLQVPLKEITYELSSLACSVIQATLFHIWDNLKQDEHLSKHVPALENYLSILALGKLGGFELNYSSDIDLIAFYDEEVCTKTNLSKFKIEDIYSDILKEISNKLCLYIEGGAAYRVDLSLRPYGKAGKLISSYNSLLKYYKNSASQWETQALIKISPIGGNWVLGFEFIWQLRQQSLNKTTRKNIASTIHRLRKEAIKKQKIKQIQGIDIKNCRGGIRDIEFLIQGLQLLHHSAEHNLLNQNTLHSLNLLRNANVLPDSVSAELRRYYTLFRRLEHFLQLMEDRQTHSLPTDQLELDALAQRLLGAQATGQLLLRKLEKGFLFVYSAVTTYLRDSE
jgi:[glutamine synthetase] adenylyltransferase / [glutamine synthetase]-adenylyl-L-tyrosine phosphorylase